MLLYIMKLVAAVILSGVLAGFGGAAQSLAVVSLFTPTVISGQGFIAMAAVIFGKWTPTGRWPPASSLPLPRPWW